MIEVVLAVGAAAAASAGAATLLHESAASETVEVAMPPDLSAEQVEVFLGTVSGLPRQASLTSVLDSSNGSIRHLLVAGYREIAAVRASLRGAATGVVLGNLDEDRARSDAVPPRIRAFVRWRGAYVLLRQDQREAAVAALLGVMHGTGPGERIQLRLRLRPVWRRRVPQLPGDQSDWTTAPVLWPSQQLSSDQVRLARAQYGGPLLRAQLEVRVWAASEQRARQFVHQLVAVLRTRSGIRGRLSARWWLPQWPAAATVLGPPELVPLLAWPLDGPVVPGVRYARAPRLLPDPAVPRSGGRTFGVSTWPELQDQRLCQPVVGALSHTLIVGPTGTGKSAVLTNLLVQDVAAGRGALLLDMKGDTALDVLARIPERRWRDVVVLDPGDPRPVPGIKSIGDARSAELAADLWMGLLRSVFRDSWGVRTERYLRLGVQTLALQPGAVITELPRLFVDRAFRHRFLARSCDQMLDASWARFDALSGAQQAEHLQAPLGKVQDLIGRSVVRRVLGQTAPRMTIARAIAERKIVVVRLPAALLGDATAQLLGALSLYEVYQAVLARSVLAPAARVPYGVYIDEPAVMRFVPIPLDSLYELARGLGVAITTATQSVSQLPDDIGRSLLINAGTLVSFRTGHQDALQIARELPEITADGIQHLGQYEIVARIALDHGHVASPATARTLPPTDIVSDTDALRNLAATRYGTDAPPTEPFRSPDGPISGDEPSALGRRRRS